MMDEFNRADPTPISEAAAEKRRQAMKAETEALAKELALEESREAAMSREERRAELLDRRAISLQQSRQAQAVARARRLPVPKPHRMATARRG